MQKTERINLSTCSYKNITIAIRVDASFQTGIGHIMRCLTFAKQLRLSGADIHFMCRQQPGDMIDYLREINYHVRVLPMVTKEYQTDAAETIKYLKTLGKIDYLVVDHYELDIRWEKLIRPWVAKLMVIDDLANREHDCHLLLDQTVGRHAGDYNKLVSPTSRLLLGSHYAMIAEEYVAVRLSTLQRRQMEHRIKHLLVSMGGTDADNVTQTIIDAFYAAHLPLELTVILGPRALHRDAIKVDLLSKATKNIHLVENASNLAILMSQADVAIGAGGTTAWERCCVGLPTLIISIAENQTTIAQQLDKMGAVKYLGTSTQVSGNELISVLQDCIKHPQFLEKMSAIAASVCDGYGVNRVIGELFPEYAVDGTVVRLRPASTADSELMFSWQCHPLTRRYARNPNPPTTAEHAVWLEKKLKNPRCIFNIILYNDHPVGVLRLDYIDMSEYAYEISILIAPEYYRRGLAKAALTLIRRIFPTLEFHAEVLPGNKASHELFVETGYQYAHGMYINTPIQCLL